MRLEQLQYLLSLQKTGSITQTAERFFISHQAISKSIKALEKELSVIILDRTSKGVILTEAGERVCQFAQNVLRQREMLQNDLLPYQMNDVQPIKGNVTVYAIPRYITPPFLKFIQQLQIAHPQMDIRLYNETAEKIIHQVPFDGATIGLFTTCYDISDELMTIFKRRQMQYRVLDQQLLYACVHKRSPLAEIEHWTEQESKNYPFVSFTYTSYHQVEDMSPTQFVVDSFEQQKALLKQGNCFSRCTVKEYELFFGRNCALIPLENKPLMRFVAIYLQEHEPVVDLFLNHYDKEIGSSQQRKRPNQMIDLEK